MGVSIDFYNPEKSRLLAELQEKASKELGRNASIQDMIRLGYLTRVNIWEVK